MMVGHRSSRADLNWLMQKWNVDIEAIDGLDALLDSMRATYSRVDALAEAKLPKSASAAPWTVERVAGSDPHHAWMFRTKHQASGSGTLADLRLAVKDSIAVAGVPMTAGSNFLQGFTPGRSAVSVERALEAGATLVGTAVCEGLCYSGSSFTSATGPVLNPHDPERSAGGSTSGCGALLATQQADIALGTDLGGSVRNPAAWCGVMALKPTFGVVPYTGALATEFSMDHLGLMARDAGSLARLLNAVAGPDTGDPRQAGVAALRGDAGGIHGDVSDLRIGIVTDGFGWPDRSDPRVDAAVRNAVEALARLCAGARETSVALHRSARDIHVPISCEGGLATVFEQNSQGSNHPGYYDGELAQAFGDALENNIDLLPLNGTVSLIAGTVLRHETRSRVLAAAQALRVVLRQQYDAALEEFDVLVMPTVPMLPHRLPKGPLAPADHQRLAFEMHDNNCATNLTGHPALSVPCAMIDGLPVGMLLIGRHLDDHLLLRLAHRFQNEVFASPSPKASGAHRDVEPGKEFRHDRAT
ncbi:amidase family protein [Mesorhizobium sp. BAC0120]|uniref:amidase family protein n=1 Tax=Mesorhizobium sp. BAC0120 TaxID=3090670 RepID=UPI00298CB3F5|nr:amidase family protein [Mesorhizobium sp. BAC0120]MDW6023194.1 amidase family protein [Mesorhizobium sp. BAC0120]